MGVFKRLLGAQSTTGNPPYNLPSGEGMAVAFSVFISFIVAVVWGSLRSVEQGFAAGGYVLAVCTLLAVIKLVSTLDYYS